MVCDVVDDNTVAFGCGWEAGSCQERSRGVEVVNEDWKIITL